uniref:hypothetical protein n=1 Tax=Burkholderia arboris TaxID=488730 RepID=UPI003BEED918
MKRRAERKKATDSGNPPRRLSHVLAGTGRPPAGGGNARSGMPPAARTTGPATRMRNRR